MKAFLLFYTDFNDLECRVEFDTIVACDNFVHSLVQDGIASRSSIVVYARRDNHTDYADFLIRWFLDVFKGRKAPFPRKAFGPVAAMMNKHLGLS